MGYLWIGCSQQQHPLFSDLAIGHRVHSVRTICAHNLPLQYWLRPIKRGQWIVYLSAHCHGCYGRIAPCTLYLAIVHQAMFSQLRTQPANAHNVLHPVSVMGAMDAQGLGGGPSQAATALFNNPLMLRSGHYLYFAVQSIAEQKVTIHLLLFSIIHWSDRDTRLE